jgi:hypothetical protein
MPEEIAPAPAQAVASQPVAPPLPASETVNYQPLSILALVSFGIASVYTLGVVIWGIFALWNKTPWLMPIWTFFVPLSAVVLAALGRLEIRKAEGTRGGLALTKWALNLSLLIGLVYIMYYTATFFAVRAQARAFADAWIQKIADDKIDEAFHETVKPPRKVAKQSGDSDKTALRRKLEIDLNAPADPNAKGAFSAFGQAEFVRLLQQAGAKDRAHKERGETDRVLKIEPEGVKDWEYEKGGYRVTLAYTVTTDQATLPLIVTVHGFESPDYSGRMWHVVAEMTGMDTSISRTPRFTPEGEQLLQLTNGTNGASKVAFQFVEAMKQGRTDDLYRLTLDAKQHAEARATCANAEATGMAIGARPATDSAGKARQAVMSGSLLYAREGVFWADTTIRQAVEDEMRSVFSYTDKPRTAQMLPLMIPAVTLDENRIIVGFDVQVQLPRDDASLPALLVEVRVHVSADKAAAKAALGSRGDKDSTGVWRVDGVELIRGRNAPVARTGGPPIRRGP